MSALVILVLKWLAVLLVSALAAGIGYERFSRWRLERRAFVGKTFVEIDGKPLHYVKKGQGAVTVVFQSGMGSSHAIWQEIQDRIAKDAVTIAYDRNGLLFSEATGRPITNDQATEELTQLLEKTGCPKPYILVGHSMAGSYLRPFIDRHAADIAGIVFIEAAHPQQKAKASPGLRRALAVPPRWLIATAVNTGVYRALFSLVPLSPDIPRSHPLHALEKGFFYRSWEKALEELANEDLNFQDAGRYGDFGAIPLTVIKGTAENRYAAIKSPAVRAEYRKLVDDSQTDLLQLSSNSRFVEALNSGHVPQIRDRELLIGEIYRMLERR